MKRTNPSRSANPISDGAPRASLYLGGVFLLLGALFSTEEARAAVQCQRNLVANVVALDQPLMFNRLGAQNINGMMFALRRDVVDRNEVPLTQGGAAVPGEVALNRLEAALSRLGAVPDFTRPALPEGRTGAPVVFLGAPQPLVPVVPAAASTPTAPATAVAPTTPAAVDNSSSPAYREIRLSRWPSWSCISSAMRDRSCRRAAEWASR